MDIYNMPLFTINEVKKAWDDASTCIIPLASIPLNMKEQIREYFLDILLMRHNGNDGFPEEPKPVKVDEKERKEDNECNDQS